MEFIFEPALSRFLAQYNKRTIGHIRRLDGEHYFFPTAYGGGMLNGESLKAVVSKIEELNLEWLSR